MTYILLRDFNVNKVIVRKHPNDSQKSYEIFDNVNNSTNVYEDEKDININCNDFSSKSCNATYSVNNDLKKLCEDSSYKNNNSENYFHDSFEKSNRGIKENCETNNSVYKNSSVHFNDSHKKINDEIRM